MNDGALPGSPALALLCKPGFEDALLLEVRTGLTEAGELPRIGDPGAAGPGHPEPLQNPRGLPVRQNEGLLIVGNAPPRLPPPFVFERQRLARAEVIAPGPHKPLAREILRRLMPPLAQTNRPWTLHAFAPESALPTPDTGRARTLERVLLELCRDRFPVAARRYVPASEAHLAPQDPVLQICLTPTAVLASVMARGELSDPCPGGLHRMAFDPLAPSRSYLKIEEALDLMGETPLPRQRVVDLGAAPGGWTWAFLKRGCHVTAVDRGPLKLPSQGSAGGRVTHLRQDGISFVPARADVPVDWLVSDMLQVAGTNIGMLRKWVENRWMRRFVVNIKLPQEYPWPALTPVVEFLRAAPGLRFSLRQLYHDRREVTAFGTMDVA